MQDQQGGASQACTAGDETRCTAAPVGGAPPQQKMTAGPPRQITSFNVHGVMSACHMGLQSPGGRSERGSRSATASKSSGRLSSCFTGSAMAASPRHLLHQGPPPTSTAPLRPSLLQSTIGCAARCPPGPRSHTRMRTWGRGGGPGLVGMKNGRPAQTVQSPGMWWARRPGGQQAPPHMMGAGRTTTHMKHWNRLPPWPAVPCPLPLAPRRTSPANESLQKGASPVVAVGARRGVPLGSQVASTTASYRRLRPQISHLRVRVGTVTQISAGHGLYGSQARKLSSGPPANCAAAALSRGTRAASNFRSVSNHRLRLRQSKAPTTTAQPRAARPAPPCAPPPGVHLPAELAVSRVELVQPPPVVDPNQTHILLHPRHLQQPADGACGAGEQAEPRRRGLLGITRMQRAPSSLTVCSGGSS